jgi:hypothetical protein
MIEARIQESVETFRRKTAICFLPPAVLFSGVADFGYDFYLLAIAKLLHGQYFRLLDFYFHTLIQQRLFSL